MSEPKADPAVVHLSAFFAQKVAAKLSAEIAGYSERNGVPIGEIDFYVGANKEQMRFRFVLKHIVNGTPIIGAPIRVFTIELKF